MSRKRDPHGRFINEGFNVNGMKKCTVCKEIKPLIEYSTNRSEKDKHNKRCKVCTAAYGREWRATHKERALKTSRKFERKNRKKRRNKCKKWRSNNREKSRAYAAKRKLAILNRTLSTLFDKEIEEIYKNCPKGYEVDHIIPLQNPLVSGLHVPWNLQYLPSAKNRSKHNRINLKEINKNANTK